MLNRCINNNIWEQVPCMYLVRMSVDMHWNGNVQMAIAARAACCSTLTEV